LKTVVEWSDRVRRELRGVRSFLQERSPQAAAHLAALIARRARRLERFPKSGRIVPEFPGSQPPLRELIIADYRLVYTYSDRRVKILTLFHGRRDFLKAVQH